MKSPRTTMNDINIINNGNLWITRAKAVRRRLAKQKRINNRPSWYKMIKIGDWRLYLTRNIKLRKKGNRDYMDNVFNRKAFRKHCYERSGHKCEICGKEVTWDNSELHHVLPFCTFPHLAMDERNMMCLCHSCHKGIHCDPYKNIRQMESKAKELGINLKDYYEV